ncbi:MAG: cytidine deaminase [Alphaproteobacteria bacterium]|nr:cytidine deaminase [Alphaproteobacteria bacterium]
MNILEEMLQMARDAMDRAYAPYSNFFVGAVIKAESGRLYAGCNVENASYPAGSCAEQGAISAMILGGDTKIQEMVVMGNGEHLVSPCGSCRQRIREFANSDTVIHICDRNGVRKSMTLEELLPISFGPENLKV